MTRAGKRREQAVNDAQELDRLIAELRAWGIVYLAGGWNAASQAEVARQPLAPAELFRGLAARPESRVRHAGIALLLRRPEWAPAITEALEGAAPAVAEEIITLALAALYLQRLWSTRLSLVFGPQPWLPAGEWARFWEARGLPEPSVCQGEAGLRALQAFERERRDLPLNFLGDWQQQVDQLLAHEWVRGANKPLMLLAPPPLVLSEEGDEAMSMRPSVDRQRIEQFLTRLAAEARQPGRIFLVGGSELVHLGLRGQTLDIDLALEAADPRAEQAVLLAIRELRHTLQINVELASPGDFIPLPAGWRERSRWVGRYGQLEVLYFDFYSLALSKIERANERDLGDVELLVGHGLVELEALDEMVQEIQPRLGMGNYFNRDPEQFAAHYALVKHRLSGGGT